MNFETDPAPRTVLLIDRDLHLIAAFKSEMESRGFRVMCTHSGREALALFAREKIDLVVSEVSLPDMPDTDLIETFAAQKRRIPIVASTSDLGYQQSFRSWAADEIVEKSHDICALFARVTALLQSPRFAH